MVVENKLKIHFCLIISLIKQKKIDKQITVK